MGERGADEGTKMGTRGSILMLGRRGDHDAIAAHLEAAGYRVERATTPNSARLILEDGDYDAFVASCDVPRGDLLDAVSAATDDGFTGEVILLNDASVQGAGASVDSLQLRAYACLDGSSVHPGGVLVVVDRAIEKRRLQEENVRLRLELDQMRGDAPSAPKHSFDLGKEVARARRQETGLGIVLLSLDNYDLILERFGPAGVEEAMSAFARTASRQLRGSDRIFLDEGRTLIALLPHAEVEGAMKAAERMADAVRVADARIGSARIDLLTSAGVAALEPSDADGQSLLNRARAALREAGRSGEALVYASGAPLATPWQRAARRLFGGGSTEWVPQIARAS